MCSQPYMYRPSIGPSNLVHFGLGFNLKCMRFACLPRTIRCINIRGCLHRYDHITSSLLWLLLFTPAPRTEPHNGRTEQTLIDSPCPDSHTKYAFASVGKLWVVCVGSTQETRVSGWSACPLKCCMMRFVLRLRLAHEVRLRYAHHQQQQQHYHHHRLRYQVYRF